MQQSRPLTNQLKVVVNVVQGVPQVLSQESRRARQPQLTGSGFKLMKDTEVRGQKNLPPQLRKDTRSGCGQGVHKGLDRTVHKAKKMKPRLCWRNQNCGIATKQNQRQGMKPAQRKEFHLAKPDGNVLFERKNYFQ